MTRVCQQFNGINLAQGFPEKSPPEEVLQEALQGRDLMAAALLVHRVQRALYRFCHQRFASGVHHSSKTKNPYRHRQ